MADMTAALFLVLTIVIQYCQIQCLQRFTPNLYLANNRVLLNHAFQWKTVSSPVICGRDCSYDPQCASFNYHTSNHVCELNNANRAHIPADFIELQGSAYYDDNLDTPSFSAPDIVHYSSCQMWFRAGHHDNGIYTIFPAGLNDALQVYCEMETNGGGWIVFQRRQDGSIDFYRNWTDYQSGFGDLSGEFWLGNDILRTLTETGQWQLLVDMEDWQKNTAWAAYSKFSILDDKYTLHLGSYDAESTAGGDSMASQNGRQFTTKDQDNDVRDDTLETPNCAVRHEGAWWFKNCQNAHLNGKYYHHENVEHGQGIQWSQWKTKYYSLKKCSMKIREVL